MGLTSILTAIADYFVGKACQFSSFQATNPHVITNSWYLSRNNARFPLSWLTPLKFNMEPENDGFQKESPFPGADLQVPC